ncbi:autophagy protein 5 [Selaginella moellendorffii]|uniref:autophagy protein 5 n=1 Tax=Selaginella moellendorffii TaxID=88036 RepID=UPI000D1CBAB5|nr:autophagy protein 5 [Selaginella moellendorffii]|eukprot:XP_024530448.1 autophagy protein 5 [Selaginella moellendorffii]
MDARRHVWEGAIPISFQLDPSEIATAPAPLPLLLMAARNGYLPLLANRIRQYFQNAVLSSPSSSTPSSDQILWFDFKGLPLKWHIPTGVLFDLLCLEPQRPWDLTVHFRGYPSEMMAPYEGDEAVKWSFMNTLKEASYIIRGNTKNVMDLTQNDQNNLWSSIVKGDMEEHDRIAAQFVGPGRIEGKPGKVPLRLYVRAVNGGLDDPFSLAPVKSWNEVMILTRPVEILRQEEGLAFTLGDALVKVLPQYFGSSSEDPEHSSSDSRVDEYGPGVQFDGTVKIQGIQPNLDLPFDWVARNLAGQEHFTHVCLWVPGK